MGATAWIRREHNTQHSLSPKTAEHDTMMKHLHTTAIRHRGQYCSHLKKVSKVSSVLWRVSRAYVSAVRDKLLQIPVRPKLVSFMGIPFCSGFAFSAWNCRKPAAGGQRVFISLLKRSYSAACWRAWSCCCSIAVVNASTPCS
jgi:hypothetical protein